MQKTIHQQFMTDIQAAAKVAECSPSTLIQKAAGRNGSDWAKWCETGSPTLRTADKIKKAIRAHIPGYRFPSDDQVAAE